MARGVGLQLLAEHVRMEDVRVYWRDLLQQYAALQQCALSRGSCAACRIISLPSGPSAFSANGHVEMGVLDLASSHSLQCTVFTVLSLQDEGQRQMGAYFAHQVNA